MTSLCERLFKNIIKKEQKQGVMMTVSDSIRECQISGNYANATPQLVG